ncbi:hypothetical protein [Arsukibacterium sp. UBA3155]|uniref:hypothetical protein n=1 Tax=Arsukibacterium sp. UBA3155 TaxID=1946058 RepID=UPI0025C56951|nr:hypothetical protein [Arsukibacterium sp. UBA3155]|tara:strand:- start:17809 stop:18174 length:366 start_codon:yes stop_codon:yes gene_type:complete
MSIQAIGRYCAVAAVLACITFNVQAEQSVSLQQSAHVCSDENETQRLAVNEQLKEMAKALAEFKPTTFCFIMPSAIAIQLLEQGESYVKFSHDGKVLYTFPEYIDGNDTANVITGLADNSL